MPVTRREFIKRSATAVSISLVIPGALLREARGQIGSAASKRRFVVIQLAGGNDGFNTVVPYTNTDYFRHRPHLAFRESELKTRDGLSTIISNEYGLHPSLGDIKQLYDAGRVAIVNGVGYPNSTLSHFLSMDIWHTADTSGLARSGWLGKYADIALVGQSGLSAISLGGLDLPKSLHANHVVVPNIINFSLYDFLTDPAHPGDHVNQVNAFNESASRAFEAGTLINSINTAMFSSVQGAAQVQSSIRAYSSSVIYPENNPLAVALKMVAQLLVTIPEAYILYVTLNGFDNHSDQIGDRRNDRANKLAGDHANLLRWFSEAVRLFYQDMLEHDLADDVLIMEWSEFGRRPAENASFGTDHGTAAPMMIIGNPVRGGLFGEHPSLANGDLDSAGNVSFKVDFREVYATILDGWLGADSSHVLGAAYPNVGFIA
jgi:uncharacterized protein (DUF1501 family)